MALPITCPKCKAQNPAGAMYALQCLWAASSAGARGTERLSFLRRTVSAGSKILLLLRHLNPASRCASSAEASAACESAKASAEGGVCRCR